MSKTDTTWKNGIGVYHGKRGDVVRIKFYDANGQQVQETLGPKAEWPLRAAKEKLRERQQAVSKKGYTKPAKALFAVYAQEWLEATEPVRDWKPKTAQQYKRCVQLIDEDFGTRKVADIRRKEINSFRDRLVQTYSARTVNLVLTVFNMVLSAAVEDQLIGENPASRIRRPKIRRYTPRVLKPKEVIAIEQVLEDDQARLAFLMLVRTGIRWGELQGLRWRDVNLVDKQLRVEDSKTEEGIRSIALDTRLAEELWQQLRRTNFQGDDEYVFCHPTKGSRWHARYYRKALRAAMEKAGVDHEKMRPAHDLRVTSLTSGALRGEHPSKLMARAGHRSYETTKVYIELSGAVFHDDAQALADWLDGKVVPSVSRPDEISQDATDSHVT